MALEQVTRTFNPNGILPEEYISKYPELNSFDETRKLKGVELQWCWYFGSKESPFVKARKEDGTRLTTIEKSQAITGLIFDKVFKGRYYDDKIIEGLRRGDIPNNWMPAIDFFKRVDTDARAEAKAMVEKMFEQYNDIVSGGAQQFVDKNGDIDYSKFSTTMKLIRNELQELIKQRERGFSVTESFIDEDSEITEGSYWNEMYLKSK